MAGKNHLRFVWIVMTLCLGAVVAAPTAMAQSAGAGQGQDHRIKRDGLPDIVIQRMSPARGRVYFATRACVVCHKVNGIGGSMAPALDYVGNGDGIDVFRFITGMWRGAASMAALQDSLFGEPIDLAPDELADIIAFLHDAAEQKKFFEKDIPDYIRDFMKARQGAPRRR